MRQAIVTRFVGPTKLHEARIIATADAGRLTVSWDYAHGAETNHRLAARALAVRLEWTGSLAGGSLPGDAGYAWVFVGPDTIELTDGKGHES